MKKKVIIICILVVLVILLFPIKLQYKDGGTIEYKAILYKVIKWHRIDNNYDSGYYEGTEIHLFPTNFHDLGYYVSPKPSKLELSHDYQTIKASTGGYVWCNSYKRCETVEVLMVGEIDAYPTLEVPKNDNINYFYSPGIIKYITVYKDSFENKYDFKPIITDETISTPNENGLYLYQVHVFNDNNSVDYYFALNVK